MAYRIDMYIGSENGSGRIAREYYGKIVEWANSTFPDGYTLLRGRGYYEGTDEDSVVLSVLTDYDTDLRGKVAELKYRLGQKSILLSRYAVEMENV